MKIDCSKEANFGDLLALLMTLIMLSLFVGILYLATIQTFASGFIAGILTLRWKSWVYVPLNNILERLWPSNLDNEKEQ
ncbi:hypothetical protein TUM3794_20460 [Shewanella colwelliana]|uniref:Uncharacterized protein n=1 Tax=Shewanella colwelliana TaxID=23 RepID=A0ABQ4P0K7_SHECO|nr:hypothetical protein [Shewanella colwelliana]GIU41028.1 hypothetical protein TUM3794_20460 [Shewanella colwelliana]